MTWDLSSAMSGELWVPMSALRSGCWLDWNQIPCQMAAVVWMMAWVPRSGLLMRLPSVQLWELPLAAVLVARSG